MKSPTVALLLAASSALGQGTFQNFDFESALIDQTHPPGFVSAMDALPSWTPFISTNQQTQIGFNSQCTGGTCIWLLGTNGSDVSSLKSIDGGFSLLLQGGVSGGAVLYPTAASIRQNGFVPSSAQSILFKAQHDTSGALSVSLEGIDIPFVALSNSPNYTLYGGDISAFAGQTALLEFSVSRFPGFDYSDWLIDSIQFSAQQIPEPNILTLFALGTVLLAWRFLRQTRHQLL
jgi:hypothetical protein